MGSSCWIADGAAEKVALVQVSKQREFLPPSLIVLKQGDNAVRVRMVNSDDEGIAVQQRA